MQNKFHSSLFLSHQPICEGKLHYFETLHSTSDYAKELVTRGAESGTLVIAEHQSLGRGRGGHQWQSPAGAGLLFTLVIDPDIDALYWHRFSIITGVAIARVIERLSSATSTAQIQLKWPNDIYINGRKCAGILTEIVDDKVIIGIGINVSTIDFPAEISHKATSLAREGVELDREPLLAAIISEIFTLGSMAGDAFTHIISHYQLRCMLSGKEVQFTAGDSQLLGIVREINDQGALVVSHPDGIEKAYMEARNIRITK